MAYAQAFGRVEWAFTPAFPRLKPWAFLCRPAERDYILESHGKDTAPRLWRFSVAERGLTATPKTTSWLRRWAQIKLCLNQGRTQISGQRKDTGPVASKHGRLRPIVLWQERTALDASWEHFLQTALAQIQRVEEPQVDAREESGNTRGTGAKGELLQCAPGIDEPRHCLTEEGD